VKYTVILEPQREGGYTVTVPALPGCISEGDTFGEAVENIKDAIAGYIESLIHKEGNCFIRSFDCH
jgi:predicted RNase H-like HicB family nuclease